MADVKREVETKFSVTGGAAQAAERIGGAMSSVGGIIGQVTGLLSPLNVALGALGTGLSIKGIADIGMQFENSQIQMAGFLTAMGRAKDYAGGLKVAESVMEKIRITAAALPGEAEEYTEVFKVALPEMAQGIGGSTDKLIDFSNRFTAIAKSFGENAGLAAVGLKRMIGAQGHMIEIMPVWRDFSAFMRQVPGHANLTAAAFNKMTQPERVKLLNAAMEKLQPMVDAAAQSMDAMWGAIKSNTKHLIKLGTTPMFEGMKHGLDRLNLLLFNADGSITEMGQRVVEVGKSISTFMVDGIVKVVEFAAKLPALFKSVFSAIQDTKAFQSLSQLTDKILGVLGKAGASTMKAIGAEGADAGGGGAQAVGAGMAYLTASLGPGVTALVSVLGNFAQNTEAVDSVFTSIVSIVSRLIDSLGPTIELLAQVGAVLGDGLAVVLPPVMDALAAIVDALMPLYDVLVTLVGGIVERLSPVFHHLFEAVGHVVTSLKNALVPIIQGVVAALSWFWDLLATGLTPVIGSAIEMFNGLLEAVSTIIDVFVSGAKKIADILHISVGGGGHGKGREAPDAAAAPGQAGYAGEAEVRSYLAGPSYGRKRTRSVAPPIPAAAGGGAAGAGGRATQDFRFSKFEVIQKFAEGFDPDRIAVAFAQDIGRIGEKRLQSAHEFPMTVR